MRLLRLFKREATAQPTPKGVNVRANKVLAGESNSLKVGACYHAIDLRANALALATMRIERKVGNAWKVGADMVTGARNYAHMDYLMQVRPNDRMTADQMWRKVMTLRDTKGMSAIYIVRTGDYVHALIPCVASWNCVSNTYELTSQEFNKHWSNIPADDVIVLRSTVNSGNSDLSLIDVARNTLSLYLTVDNFATETIAKGGSMKMFVSEETSADALNPLASMDDKEVKSAVDDMREQVSNNEDIIFTQGDLKVEQRSQSFQDLQVQDHKTKAIEDVARIFGIPLPLMFCSTNAVYKSMDDAFHTFLSLTMQPIYEEVEQEMTAKLLGEDIYGKIRFRFDTSALCLDSESIKATTASSRRAAGITTANEERAYMGLPAIEGGDTLNNTPSTVSAASPADDNTPAQ